MEKTYTLHPTIPAVESEVAIDYGSLLNPSQQEAVLTLHGPILCVAGAGSGKTRTLIYRVARLLETGVPPTSILLLTFTRKAAANMLERAAALIGERARQVSGGTYHSFAHQMLRKHAGVLGLDKHFSIIDGQDSADIINLLRTEGGWAKKDRRYPKKKTIQHIFSMAVNHQLPLQDILTTFFSHFEEHLESLKVIFAKLQEFKANYFLLDYDDLLVQLLRLLKDFPEIRSLLSHRYRFIMVDEYQDTNLLQASITQQLAHAHQNIMVVGDDAQSIYSFRGATVRNILDFPEKFEKTRIIKLETNYRSCQEILTSTNALMRHAKESYAKELHAIRGAGRSPVLVVCGDEAEQSRFISQRILELREQGIPLSEMAVLFRSGYHAYHLELELKNRNIPFSKWGGLKFLEAAHIKNLLCHLRILQNPADRVSWQRVLLLLNGVGTKTFGKLMEQIQALKNPFQLEAVRASEKVQKGLARLGKMLERASQHEQSSPQVIVELAADYYLPLMKDEFDDYPKRLKDIDQVAILSSRYPDLVSFLAELALEPPRQTVENTPATDTEDDELLILSTVHSAKGLEWKVVFVIWLLDGRFPSFASFRSSADLDEERRLLYVAMTRAKDHLYLTYPSSSWDAHSGGMLSRPSRFLEEFGHAGLETWRLQTAV